MFLFPAFFSSFPARAGDEHAGVTGEGGVLHQQGGPRVPCVRRPSHGAVPHVQAAQAASRLPSLPSGLP